MNNEEKILSMLEEMNGRLSTLEEGQAELKEGLAITRSTVARVEKDLAITRGAIAKIENEHGKLLQAIIDGQVAQEEKLQDHQPRIVRLEDVTEKHSLEIAALRKAK